MHEAAPAPDAPAPEAQFRILAQCPPGLEPTLGRELEALGVPASGQTKVVGGIVWQGGWRALLEANLHLRVASRVLIEIGSFRARALGELTRKAALDVDWARVRMAAADDPGRIRFRISASRSRLYHEGAIEARLREAAGLPPEASPDPAAPPDSDVLIVVRVHRDTVTVRLDTSGAHLHQRGYRQHVGLAPMRETLGAALLLQGPFSEPMPPTAPTLLDPFCGSGTIPIEAALLARRIPPGMASPDFVPRAFACLAWPDAPKGLWDEIVAEARDRILPAAVIAGRIVGSDRDASVVEAARANAMRAGVAEDVHFEVENLSRAPLAEHPGWVVTNPPFGTRLGGRKSLRPLYQSLGRSFLPDGRMAGWSLLYLSADPVLDQVTGLPLEVRMTTQHGGLSVRAMAFTARE
jgi:putative N6-adenine-specific DNA methylase